MGDRRELCPREFLTSCHNLELLVQFCDFLPCPLHLGYNSVFPDYFNLLMILVPYLA